ncbi:hypothetical protein WJX72_001253 [[Myrmecia] bisecta]|uniref:Uncharacterized protein n=1 Tax=[Myrmecia] bisecta TaxID=41462 RepID=A0AAW1P5H6_9CHLO
MRTSTDLVRVLIYNMVPEGLDLRQKQAFTERNLPRGTSVAILEPFYKLMADGNYGVRVDNPAEVIFLERVGPADAAEWQEEGKRHFQAVEYQEAIHCYDRALALLDKAPSNIKGAGASSGGSRSGRQRGLTESELHAMEAEGHADVEQVAFLNQMLEMMTADPAARANFKRTDLGGAMRLDERVPPFHQEFAKEGRWPVQCNVDACQRHLWNAYELARGMAIHILGLTKPEHIEPMLLMTRLGSNNPAALEWLATADMGSLRFHPRMPYQQQLFHSFGNVPARKEILTPGTTHVAVGFLDLGSLAAACMAWEECVPPGEGPLRWIGYDCSPYAVAKTLVIARMLCDGAGVDHILQVWYSAAWSLPAHRAFRSALTALLSTPSASDLPPRVQQLLRHWQVHDVPLAESRAKWLASTTRANAQIGNFRVKADRLALCEYLLTVQLLESEVGSVVMFAIPEGFGERAHDEVFLQTLPASEILGCRLSEQAADVMSAGVLLLRRRLERLQGLMRAGKVTVEVRLGTVEPSAASTLAAIRSVKPYSISWSNVCDYYSPKAFHAMAKACSAPEDTVHYLHTMNWVRDVKGSCHLDYMMAYNRPDLTKFMLEDMLKGAQDAIQDMYQVQGFTQLLHCPPVANPRNVIDYCLTCSCYKAWVDAFFTAADLEDVERQVHVAEPPMYSTFSRANTTLSLIYTFDSAIHLRIPGPFQGHSF